MHINLILSKTEIETCRHPIANSLEFIRQIQNILYFTASKAHVSLPSKNTPQSPPTYPTIGTTLPGPSVPPTHTNNATLPPGAGTTNPKKIPLMDPV